MSSEMFVHLLVNDAPVMTRRFDARHWCETMELTPADANPSATREKCLRQNIQAEFFYQGAFNNPVSIALGTSVDMGPHIPVLTSEKFTQLVVTFLGAPPPPRVVKAA